MSYGSKKLLTDSEGMPIPQYYDPSIDDYVPHNGTFRRTITDVVLQNAATAVGNGSVYTSTLGNATLTFAIKGSSTSRSVNFEIADSSGVYVACTAFGIADPTLMNAQTTSGIDTAPQHWQVEVPAGYSFRARISAVSGGNITISGKAVV